MAIYGKLTQREALNISYWDAIVGWGIDPSNYPQPYYPASGCDCAMLPLGPVPPPAPLPPYSLTATSGSVILNWVGGNNTQNYFSIWKSINGIVYSNIDTSLLEIYTDTDVTSSIDGTTYWYQIAAVNEYGTSSFSNTASITFIYDPPVGPITASVASGSALVSWTSSIANADVWHLYRSFNYGGFGYIGSFSPNTYSYRHEDVTASVEGNTYSYKVYAANSYGSSDYSNTASITFTIPLFLPTASFTGTPLSGAAPLAVTFTNASSNATIYNWSFGDAIFSSAINPVHTYTNPGVYDVGLMASGSAGVSYLTQSAYVSASSAPTLDPTLAWWTMDSGTANNELDSLNGTALATAYNPAWATTVAGKVNNALQFSCSAGVSVANVASDAALMSSGTGSTIVFWLNVTDDIPQGTNYVSLNYRFDQNATNYTTMIDRSGVAPNNWTVYVNGTPYITATSATGWHFFAITFDILTGTLGLDIDQAGMTTQAAIIPTAGANTTGRVYMGGSGGTVGSFLMQVDEFAVYNQVLTNTQLNYLYNSGTGRTWPVTLPP